MRWKEALRNELNKRDVAAEREPLPPDPRAVHATHRAIVRRAFFIGATVLEEAHAELMLAGHRAMLECDTDRNALRINDRWLEVTRLPSGTELEVRRRGGFSERLHAADDQLLDGSGKPIGSPENYFGDLVVTLVTGA